MHRRYFRGGNSWFICYRWRSKFMTKIQIWRYRYFRYKLLRCPWFYFRCAVGEQHEHARSNLKRTRLFHVFASYILLSGTSLCGNVCEVLLSPKKYLSITTFSNYRENPNPNFKDHKIFKSADINHCKSIKLICFTVIIKCHLIKSVYLFKGNQYLYLYLSIALFLFLFTYRSIYRSITSFLLFQIFFEIDL